MWESFQVDSPEYKRVHKKIAIENGLASNQKCNDCESPAVDWCYIHGENPAEVSSYLPRCRSCHMKYDGPTVGVKNGSAKLSPEDVFKIKEIYSTSKYSQREVGLMFGVKRQTVTNIITGKKWKSAA